VKVLTLVRGCDGGRRDSPGFIQRGLYIVAHLILKGLTGHEGGSVSWPSWRRASHLFLRVVDVRGRHGGHRYSA
jgi:hypothetical protein